MTPLSTQALGPIITQAIAEWSSAAAVPQLKSRPCRSHATYQIGTLPPGEVGSTTGNIVTISPDAAGAGWFVDPTPADNS